jgi:hypothetical protein
MSLLAENYECKLKIVVLDQAQVLPGYAAVA